jgi:hypothetical protein
MGQLREFGKDELQEILWLHEMWIPGKGGMI